MHAELRGKRGDWGLLKGLLLYGRSPMGGRKTLMSPRVINYIACQPVRCWASAAELRQEPHLGIAAAGVLEQRPPKGALVCTAG